MLTLSEFVGGCSPSQSMHAFENLRIGSHPFLYLVLGLSSWKSG